ncbi:flagellar protein FlgN [Geomonas sp. RF6]|uniref:flagellar protein FlgN n=1 Tax=Geomonas sp. RF6 TaxID=2897342 RepID=UPI001E3CDB97|nr:flagellar protein FlgN [Geomonas sp. RF6]UFS72408.1 flagellar protein FlgN [Geomonas sp. RF6]
MKQQIALLAATLKEEKTVLGEVRSLLEQEQTSLSALDLPAMEESQQALAETLEKLELLSRGCRNQISSLAASLGISEPASLSPVIARLAQPEQGALKKAQDEVITESRALNRALELHRGLLHDSLSMVNYSVNFFNRLFNPVDTYGNAGSLVARRGGSRFVCKEI